MNRIAAILSLTAAAMLIQFAQASPPMTADHEVAELRALVSDLQRQVDELKSANDADWLTQQRAEEIRELVHDVLADADTRASLLQDSAAAGYNNGFFIGSADGNFLLKVGGQLQFRAVYNNLDDDSGDDTTRFGFEMRRAKVFFAGHIVDSTWEYSLELDSNRSGGTFALGENGWIRKKLEDGWAILAGQFKPAFLREEMISSRRLQTVERSLVNAQFTTGTAQGVQLSKQAERWRVFASFHDGRGTANTAWQAEDSEYAITGRVEHLARGDWKDVDHDVAFPNEGSAILLGAALHFQRDEFGTGSNLPAPDFNNAEVKRLGLTGDVTLKFERASVAAALIYQVLDVNGGAEFDQIAFVVRGGYFMRDDIELYAMLEWGDLDVTGAEELTILTVGATKYWAKHSLKWQSDIGFGINGVDPAWAVSSAGWRADGPDSDGQIVLRSQLQLLF